MASPRPKVYRVRNLPFSLSDAPSVARFLSDRLGDVATDDVDVCSVASDTNQLTKTATVLFRQTPRLLTLQPQDDVPEWVIGKKGGGASVIIDAHFIGVTPLATVDDALHQFK